MDALNTPLTNLQLELLKIYSINLSDSDLLEIKKLLARHFAKKAIEEADNIWQEKGYTNEEMGKWINDDNT